MAGPLLRWPHWHWERPHAVAACAWNWMPHWRSVSAGAAPLACPRWMAQATGGRWAAAACASGQCWETGSRWWCAMPCTNACGCCGANRERRDAHADIEAPAGGGAMRFHHAPAMLALLHCSGHRRGGIGAGAGLRRRRTGHAVEPGIVGYRHGDAAAARFGRTRNPAARGAVHRFARDDCLVVDGDGGAFGGCGCSAMQG